MTTADFVLFRKKRKEYESKVEEKNKEAGVCIAVTTYANSMDESLLRMLYHAEWIQAESFETITEENIRQCIQAM